VRGRPRTETERAPSSSDPDRSPPIAVGYSQAGERRSLRKISADLAAAGFVNERGKPYHAQSIMRMIEGQRPD